MFDKDIALGWYFAFIMMISIALLLNSLIIMYPDNYFNYQFLAKYNLFTAFFFLLLCFRRIYKILGDLRK